MTVLNTFFSTPIAFGIWGLALFAIGLLIKQNRGQKLKRAKRRGVRFGTLSL